MTDQIDAEIKKLHQSIKDINSQLDQNDEYTIRATSDRMLPSDESSCKESRLHLQDMESFLYRAYQSENDRKPYIDKSLEAYFSCKYNILETDECDYLAGLIDGSDVWSQLKSVCEQLNIDYRKR